MVKDEGFEKDILGRLTKREEDRKELFDMNCTNDANEKSS